MNTPKTDYLRKAWTDYVSELNRMRWDLLPGNPDLERFNQAFATLKEIAGNIKSTAEIEEGDIVTNGTDTFEVLRVQEDRVYDTENTFHHANTLRIKSKFK